MAGSDACKLDFADETFDAVTSNYVYHNIPSKDRQAILLETLRTLKKGGTFAIHDIMSKAKYGVDYEMIVGEGMFHCYPAFPIVKEAKEGWYKMVNLIRNTTKQGSMKNAI
ncbi:methyltransferase domain-containing protein [Butyrivibrio sp. AE2032]|uniref:methyltransferase domain-containing protein n=1 Tax=Butyrivibrio sp. AE2032 TaxID=1458463 RepID=UPI00054E3580|nr:methyltransferase domain-containing protein [Butyrivibrio sp. AE2032]